jgi:phenylacetate-CoA ligase
MPTSIRSLLGGFAGTRNGECFHGPVAGASDARPWRPPDWPAWQDSRVDGDSFSKLRDGLVACHLGGRDASCIRKALVSGAAFPRSLREGFDARGIAAYQAHGTADIGFVAFETEARDGMVVNEDIILEIVRSGTNDPVPDGEVGEIVVTTLDTHHPMIRLALGDLTAALPGLSPCGRSNRRIRGWMGRADQTAKVRGMFVRPEQIAEIARRHPSLGRLRLVVTRANENDGMTLLVESSTGDSGLQDAIGATLQAITKLRGTVEIVAVGSLLNDGKVIADERPVR